MRSPRTEAGKALLEREALNGRSFTLITTDAILAIEAEAAIVEKDSYLTGFKDGMKQRAEAAAPPSGEGLDAADRHEGPTPRDCPECLRLHDDES